MTESAETVWEGSGGCFADRLRIGVGDDRALRRHARCISRVRAMGEMGRKKRRPACAGAVGVSMREQFSYERRLCETYRGRRLNKAFGVDCRPRG